MHQEWPAEFERIKHNLEQHCHNLSRRKYGYPERTARGPSYLMDRFPLVMQYMPRPNFWILFPCLRYDIFKQIKNIPINFSFFRQIPLHWVIVHNLISLSINPEDPALRALLLEVAGQEFAGHRLSSEVMLMTGIFYGRYL